MEYVAVIDLSSFIWCEEDFAKNTHKYYELMQKMPVLYDKLNENKSIILLREEIYFEIMQYFPYRNIPSGYHDFETITFAFLGNLGSRMLTYPSIDDSDISSIPNLLKKHFSNSTKTEMRFLITRIHSARIPDSVYFTFAHFWNNTAALITNKKKRESYTYKTIIFDDERNLDKFFNSKKIIFEHNPKHNKYTTGNYESPLSCYNNRKKDTSKAQKLLDEAYRSGQAFYNFDFDNDVWVVFRSHEEKKYHGFNQNNRELIPPEIRRKLNK